MDPEKIKAALEAIKNGDADAALALLEEMIASAAGAGGEEAGGESDALADTADPPAEEEAKPAEATALSRAVKLAEKQAAEIEKLTARLSKLESSANAAENAERVKLVGELVKLGVEFPATAWEGKPEAKKPVARLASEPIESLRQRVELHRKNAPARGFERPEGDDPEVAAEVEKLSKDALDFCKKEGITPAEFVARKRAAVRRHK
jgi:hypothetical protein